MIKIPCIGHAAIFMKLQNNPSNGLENIYESKSEFKEAVST